MKHLISFCFAMLCSTAALATTFPLTSPDYCRDASNQWTLPNTSSCSGGVCGVGNATYTIIQNSDGTISGTVSNSYCIADQAYHNWTLHSGSQYSHYVGPPAQGQTWGDIDGTLFSLRADQIGECAIIDDLVIKKGEPGCAKAQDISYQPTVVYATAPALVPDSSSGAGETSAKDHWSSNFALLYNKVTLKPPSLHADNNGHGGGDDTNYDWSGRMILERFTGQSVDTAACRGPITGYPDGAEGSHWYITDQDGVNFTGSNWYADGNGYTANSVLIGYIRLANLNNFPCGYMWNGTNKGQDMYVDDPNGAYCSAWGSQPCWTAYDHHILVNQLPNATQVHIERSTGDDQTETWGMTGWAFIWNQMGLFFH